MESAGLNIGADRNGNVINSGDVCRIVRPPEGVRMPPPHWLGTAGVAVDRFGPGRSGYPRVVFRPIGALSLPDEIYVWTPAVELLPGRGTTNWREVAQAIGWSPRVDKIKTFHYTRARI